MMNINDMYPSKYVKAADLPQPVQAVIASVQMEIFKRANGQDEQKPVLYLQGHTKGIVCNKTNLFVIGEMYGQETNGWVGMAVTLTTAPTQTPTGEPTIGVRILPPITMTAQQAQGPGAVGTGPRQAQPVQQPALAPAQQAYVTAPITPAGGFNELNPPPQGNATAAQLKQAVDDDIPFAPEYRG